MELSRKKAKRKRSSLEIVGFLVIAVFVFGLIWLMLPTSPPNTGQATTTAARVLATDFTLTDVDGRTFRLSDYRGKAVVIEFMRTTCGACITQEAELRELRSKFGSEVVMVIISIDPSTDTESLLRQHRNQNLMGWIAIRDTAKLYDTYGTKGTTPTIFIIDKNGYIAYQHVGITKSSVLISEVRSVA